jgi:hypothetical protein
MAQRQSARLSNNPKDSKDVARIKGWISNGSKVAETQRLIEKYNASK